MPEGLKTRILESETQILTDEKERLEKSRKRVRTLLGLLAGAVLTLGVAGYFWWDANRQKQAADKAQTEATDALLKFKNGQAAKAANVY